MKLKEYTNIQDYIEKKNLTKMNKTELITKKELLEIAVNDPDSNIDDLNIYKLKQMKVSELREILKITHKITSDKEIHYVNNFGHCFNCFKLLKPDYIKYKNYCRDC
jgi:hypothetical protein